MPNHREIEIPEKLRDLADKDPKKLRDLADKDPMETMDIFVSHILSLQDG